MATIGYATLQIIPSMRGVQQAIQRDLGGAGDAIGAQTSKGILGRLGGVGGAAVKTIAKGAAAAGGIGGAIFGGAALAKGFNRLTTIENATKSLEITLGSASEAGKFLDGVLEVVRGTPFNLDQFANAGKNLVAFGVGAEKVPGYLTAIGESAAASGKGAEAVDRVVDAFGKMAAQGKVSLDQVWSISDTGVPALQILANEFGVTTEEMQKLISSGAVPAERAMDALAEGIVNGSDGAAGATIAFKGSMEGLRTTLTGALGGFNAAMARYGAAILAPFSPGAVAVLTSAADLVDAVGERAGAVAQRLADTGALERFAGGIDAIPGALDRAQRQASVFLAALTGSGGIDAFVSNARDLGATLSGPLAGGLATARTVLGDVLAAITPVATEAGTRLLPAVQDLAGPLAQLWSTLSPVAVLFRALAPVLPQLAGSLATVAGALAQGIVQLLPSLLQVASALGGALLDALIELAPAVAAVAPALGTALASAVRAVVPAIVALSAALVPVAQVLAPMAPVVLGVWAAYKGYVVVTGAAAAMRAFTVATVASTLAKGRNLAAGVALRVMYVQQAAAMVAARVAMIAGTVAAGAMAVAQRLLNAAMKANPIGIIITILGLLVGAIVYAYKNSETFRNIVNAAWTTIKNTVATVWAFLRDNVLIPLGLKVIETWRTFQTLRSNLDVVWAAIKQVVRNSVADIVDRFMGMVGTVIQGAADAFSWVPGLGPKLQEAASKFDEFRNNVNAAIRGIDAERTVEIRAELNATADALVKAGADPAAAAKRVRNIGLATGGGVYGPGTGTSDSIPAMLSNGEHVWTAKEVQAAGGHGAIKAMRQEVLHRAEGGPVVRRGVRVETDLGGTDSLGTLAERLNAGSGALLQSMSGYVKGLEGAAKQAAAAMVNVGGGMGPIPRGDGWVRPIKGGVVTSEYGPRGGRMHSGIDVSTGGGATIYAARAGRVKNRKYQSSWGNHVQIQHDTGMTNYAHMVRPGIVSPGQLVKAGQAIGTEGNTGNSFGAHLHFEWSPNGSGRVNPRRLGLFDKGGIARGKGWMPKGVIAPERTLDPRQTVAFERLVGVLDRPAPPVATAPAGYAQPNFNVYVEASPGTRDFVRREARIEYDAGQRRAATRAAYDVQGV